MLNNDEPKRDLIGRTVVTKLLATEKVGQMTDVDQVSAAKKTQSSVRQILYVYFFQLLCPIPFL